MGLARAYDTWVSPQLLVMRRVVTGAATSTAGRAAVEEALTIGQYGFLSRPA